MGTIVRFGGEDGADGGDGEPPLFVEVEEGDYGLENIARDDRSVIVQASAKLDDALHTARRSLRSLIAMLEEMAPDEHEIEFGIKLNAEAGVLVAKTAAESHFAIKMKWSRKAAAGRGEPSGTGPAANG